MSDVLDYLSAQIERVRTKLVPLFESSSQVAGLVKDLSEEVKISRYLYRIPVELFPGGAFAKYSANGGAGNGLGVGHTGRLTHMTAGYFYSRLAFSITQETIDTTDSSEQSVVKAFNHEMGRAISTAQIMDDIVFHTDGTGVLTNGASAYAADTPVAGKSTYTFAGASDTLGVNRIRPGMAVVVWQTGLAATRDDTVRVIEAIDYANKRVVLSSNLTNTPAATDKLAFPGLTAYGPSTLTSFSSGWPTAPGSQVAAGLSGDSFRHGMYYFNNTTGTNYVLGIERQDVPELIPATISAGGAGISFSHGLDLWSELQARRDGDGVDSKTGLVGILHMDQRKAIFNLGTVISNKDITGTTFGKSLDLLPDNHKYVDKVDFAGVPCIVSKRQYRDRIDFICPSKWGRAMLTKLDFLTLPGSSTKIHARYSTVDGSPVPEYLWYLGSSFDYFCVDPGSQAFISGLAVPA